MNAMRNNNTQMFNKLGADVGFDSINDSSIAYPLSRLLDSIETGSTLPKTILFSSNALDNDVIGIMCNLIGEWVENGEFPCDMELLGSIVQGICYDNAKEYFKI